MVKIGEKRKKLGWFFHLPPVTDRAGYTTAMQSSGCCTCILLVFDYMYALQNDIIL